MHNLLLGILKRHCLDIWGMKSTHPDGDGLEGPVWQQKSTHKKEPTAEEKTRAWQVLREAVESRKLGELYKRQLMWLCAVLNMPWRGTVASLRTRIEGYLKAGKQVNVSPPSVDALQTFPSFASSVQTSSSLVTDTSAHSETMLKPGPRSARRRAMPDEAAKLDFSVPRNSKDLEKALQYVANSDVASLSKLRVGILQRCCQDRGLPYAGPKAVAAAILCGAQAPEATQTADDNGPAVAAKTGRKHPVVLGQGVLHEVNLDMERSVRPSWLGQAPTNLGSTRHGKMSADQWRTTCTVDLVITLVRIWGPKAGRFHDMLDNYMDMVVAVKIAHKRSTSPELAELYYSHMIEYTRGILRLYPGNVIVSDNHLALHLKDLLLQFGPIQAWRAFPFEWLNGILQNVGSNMKLNDIEQTVAQNFVRGCNLRQLVADDKLPKELDPVLKSFEKVFSSDFRGTLLSDMIALGSSSADVPDIKSRQLEPLPSGFAILFGPFSSKFPPRIAFFRDYHMKGLRFSTHSHLPKNSHIVFAESDTESPRAGRIHSIFVDPGDKQVYLVLDVYKTLSAAHVQFDYYRAWPLLAGSLYYDDFELRQALITPSAIVCHAVKTAYIDSQIGKPCVHILPLDRKAGMTSEWVRRRPR
ncbi:hypothetical protein BOTBODRAFT_182161 [Botryobasidium botryosum FD-172 SS1]|uniref:SAP domain-containing protein n=1 Tax=Botryobasidium botryosum (strain FD-172 SS1) TaxID=930990 RepID=A0A067LRN0_BOTB1|nr:hypothetical protein BOTBODRAFT_182161 [Botryobasidium botryosum FD-172 SS1]